MTNSNLPKPLRGVIPPLVTPLADENNLDLPGLKNLLEHLIGGGVHGIFLLGTTGEGPSLSQHLKREMIKHSCRIINGRIPVLVGISDPSFPESLKLADFAAGHGADAVVLTPPYYFPAGQPELLEYLSHLVPKLPLPMFLYNIPAMTKIDITVNTLRKAAEIEGIAGFKDSSGNMTRFHEYIFAMRDKPEFSLLSGNEELLGEAVMFGGHGGITGGANVNPRLFVEMYEAAASGNLGKVLSLQEEIYIGRELYFCGRYTSGMIKGIKCALNCMGICKDFMAEPFHAFHEPERERIMKILKEICIR